MHDAAVTGTATAIFEHTSAISPSVIIVVRLIDSAFTVLYSALMRGHTMHAMPTNANSDEKSHHHRHQLIRPTRDRTPDSARRQTARAANTRTRHYNNCSHRRGNSHQYHSPRHNRSAQWARPTRRWPT